MTKEKPYFMSNKDWYLFDKENIRYILTDAARKADKDKAIIKSYNKFYGIYDWISER